MKIKFIDIQNFRKLKCTRINFSDEETLFIGANNSGKTSAMDALISFLSQKTKLTQENQYTSTKFYTTDFTLSNWNTINKFGESWSCVDAHNSLKGSLLEWQDVCPSLDIWLKVEINEVHKVSHLIPTLKWTNDELIGVRLIYQPKNIETLKSTYLADYNSAKDLKSQLENKNETTKTLSLWPITLHDYLDRKLNQHFEIKAYILDPEKKEEYQKITDEQSPLDSYPFHGIFKVDVIEAQRGFSDPNSSHSNSNKSDGNLSAQLNQYYSRHLNPTELPDEGDIKALKAIDNAKDSFDDRLNESFKDALDEIKTLGYPGFNDPNIKLSSKINPVESLDHEAAILFEVPKQTDGINSSQFSLPEKYNGLGYKNLIYMTFKLISFRDQWIRKGKASKRRTDIACEPLHLVLIEEPEAHLHVQVQQVFIRKSYEVLRNGIDDARYFSTQMIVSSHSSYLAHEVGFDKLRYFKRQPAGEKNSIPCANVVDLSEIFGEKNKRASEKEQTAKFVSRYLKTTHCDLFFANGVIMVEGAAERILLPHFINTHFKELNSSYISILEVGGAHAQRLKPLIESLGLPTLVITDTDAVNRDNKNKKTQPLREKGYYSGSDTLNSWFKLKGKNLDEILDLPSENKIKGNVRAAYQYGIQVYFSKNSSEKEAIPYTFEDAIALTNIELIKELNKPTGMLKKMQEAFEAKSLDVCCEMLYESLAQDKAKMALDLLFYADPSELKTPIYIEEGLEWLQSKLKNANDDFLPTNLSVKNK